MTFPYLINFKKLTATRSYQQIIYNSSTHYHSNENDNLSFLCLLTPFLRFNLPHAFTHMLTDLPSYSSEIFNAEVLTSFTSLLVSLLEHQQRWTTSAEITITKHQCIQICQLWRSLFGNIDIYKKLHVFITKGKIVFSYKICEFYIL